MEDGVAGLDVGEEGVAEALSLRGALHQASDVRHVEERGHFAEMRGIKLLNPFVAYLSSRGDC